MFYFEKIKEKRILKSSVLTGLNHFFTTKESFIKTKDPENFAKVEKNRQIVCDYFGIESPNLIYPSQTHTSNIEVAKIGKDNYPDTDGLILTNKKQAIFLNFADCTPLVFYDGNIAAVSHAVSFCCYNVGQDVYKQLISTVSDSSRLYEIRGGEIFVDLKSINKKQLIEAGLKEENIDICPYCTVCNNDLFFSYRKENGTTNRHSAVIKL